MENTTRFLTFKKRNLQTINQIFCKDFKTSNHLWTKMDLLEL